jgi:hypothetical protein
MDAHRVGLESGVGACKLVGVVVLVDSRGSGFEVGFDFALPLGT